MFDKLIELGYNITNTENQVIISNNNEKITIDLDDSRFWYSNRLINKEVLNIIEDICIKLGIK